MRSQLILPAIFVCILHAACTKQKEELATSYFKPPKIVEAKTNKVPLEKAVPAKVVPALGMKKILAGKPETVHLKSNVFSAKPTRVILAGPLKLSLLNKEVYNLPEVVPAVGPFTVGAPEIILMKDRFIKESNERSELSV